MSLLVHSWGARLRALGKDRRLWGGVAILIVAFALLVLPHRAFGFTGESYLAGALAWILGLIVSFLGKIISVLIYILMGFLKYNGFADAPPVVMGWVIVRDFVNMLFIVVLLISAVATILNYDTHDLHVKNVLPNLIAAAILINFSKMIVGLLVDASQVVTLTFVNAFQASGVGNFAQVLGLPSFTTLTSSTGDTAAGRVTRDGTVGATADGQIIFDVLLAYMLAMMMLVISIGVVLIMILFTVGRIVGLWVLLIMSPAAMFATCMPKKLQKMFGSLEHEFWEKLTGLCVGGPIMSFFLWLSFATVRSAQGGTVSVAQRLQLFTPDTGGLNQNGIIGPNVFNAAAGGADLFLSRVGNADGIASFIVGVALMMIGIDQAVKASGAAGDLVKGYADSIKKQAKSSASWIANRPGAAVGGLANIADRRMKLTDKVASSINMIPMVDTLTSGKLRKFSTYRKDEMKKMGAADAEHYGKLSGRAKENWRGRTEFMAKNFPIGSDADKTALAAMNKEESSEASFKKKRLELNSKYENEMKANRPLDEITGQPITDDELKNRAKTHAHGEAAKKRAQRWKEGYALAKSQGDWGAASEFEEAADKDPQVLKGHDDAGFESRVKKMSDEDFEKNSTLNEDFDALFVKGKQEGAYKVGADGKIQIDEQGMQKWIEKMPKATKNIRAHEGQLRGSVDSAGAINLSDVQKKYGGSRVQAIAKSTPRVHSGATGDRVMSDGERITRSTMHSAFDATGRGRTPTGVLTPQAANLADIAFDTLGVGAKELQDISKGTADAATGRTQVSDNAMTRHLVGRVGTDLANLATVLPPGSTRTRSDVVNESMKTLSRLGEQIDDLDEKTQAAILDKIDDPSMADMERDMDSGAMSSYQVDQLAKIFKKARALTKSSDPAVQASALRVISEGKSNFLQSDQKDATGAVVRRAAPKPITAALYNS